MTDYDIRTVSGLEAKWPDWRFEVYRYDGPDRQYLICACGFTAYRPVRITGEPHIDKGVACVTTDAELEGLSFKVTDVIHYP